MINKPSPRKLCQATQLLDNFGISAQSCWETSGLLVAITRFYGGQWHGSCLYSPAQHNYAWTIWYRFAIRNLCIKFLNPIHLINKVIVCLMALIYGHGHHWFIWRFGVSTAWRHEWIKDVQMYAVSRGCRIHKTDSNISSLHSKPTENKRG